MNIPDLASLFQLPMQEQGGLFSLHSHRSQEGMFSGLLESVFAQEGQGIATNSGEVVPGLLPLAEEALVDVGEESELSPEDAVIFQLVQMVSVVYKEVAFLSSAPGGIEGLDDIQELSAAYQELGLSPEEANSRAARLVMMMLLMDGRISTADLLEGLRSPQFLGLEEQHQVAFLKIEKSIEAFSAASVGSDITLIEAIRREDMTLLKEALPRPEVLLTELAQSGMSEKAFAQPVAGETLLISEEAPLQLLGNRTLADIFETLAQQARQHPEGEELAKQLESMSKMVERVSDKVVADGGFQSFELSLRKILLSQQVKAENSEAKIPPFSVQNVSQQGVQDAGFVKTAEESIQAQIAKTEQTVAKAAVELKEQIEPKHNVSKASDDNKPEAVSRADKPVVKQSDFSRSHATRTREPALLEPKTAAYVVRPAAVGGVEVVNPQTGEVIQASNAGLSASAPTNQGGQAPQTRESEIAMQGRLAKQVQVHVRNLATHGGGQIVVGLNPPELGRIQVRLEILEGQVKGAITVQRPDVAETITRDLRALEMALKDVGLELNKEGIAIQLENNPADQNKEQHQAHQNGSGTGIASTELSEEFDAASQGSDVWVNPDRLLDVRA